MPLARQQRTTETTMTWNDVTLSYFDAPVSRGEECRLALTLAGVRFKDDRVGREQWPARKAATPFGALPVLAVDGQQLAQTNAILHLIGREFGLLPEGPFEAARHLSVMEAVEDLRHTMGPILRIKDEAEKRARREEAAKGYLPDWAARVEAQIVGPFLGGAKVSVADLKLFVVLGPYLKGSVDHVPTTVFSGAPKLLALREAVAKVPAVAGWYARK
jgi:prostaglandin-H2 D-isomerase / glutathione transferase